MELNDKVTQLEDEIKILKNEVQAVLLDLRESYLSNENPFNARGAAAMSQPIIINQPGPGSSDHESPYKPPSEEILEPDPVENEPEIPVEEFTPQHTAAVPDDEPDSEPDIENEAPQDFQSEPEPLLSSRLHSINEPVTAGAAIKGWRPNADSTSPFFSGKAGNGKIGKIDLDNISELAKWVETTVKQLGPTRTEAALDISEMLGHVSPELKSILVKFINPVSAGTIDKVTTKDYLASLIELAGLLGRDNRSEVALLYILCQENENR